jgi:glycosyltransferase involved in cell wall biosynthesis
MKIEFCLPVYNESLILQKNLDALLNYCEKQNFSFDWQVIIIVNGSSTEFENLAFQIAQKQPSQVKTIIYKEKGRGQAVKKYWLSSLADILVYMDVDLAVSLDNIPNLINPIIQNTHDLTIGSRMMPGSKRDRSLAREASSQIYVLLSRLILKHDYSDLQCGFKGIRRSFFEKIAPKIKDNFWFFDTELIYFTKESQGRILEIPVNWSENRFGFRKSKVNVFRDSLLFIQKLIELRLRKKID